MNSSKPRVKHIYVGLVIITDSFLGINHSPHQLVHDRNSLDIPISSPLFSFLFFSFVNSLWSCYGVSTSHMIIKLKV